MELVLPALGSLREEGYDCDNLSTLCSGAAGSVLAFACRNNLFQSVVIVGRAYQAPLTTRAATTKSTIDTMVSDYKTY